MSQLDGHSPLAEICSTQCGVLIQSDSSKYRRVTKFHSLCVVETKAVVCDVGFLVISVNFNTIKSAVAFAAGLSRAGEAGCFSSLHKLGLFHEQISCGKGRTRYIVEMLSLY